MKKRVLTSFFLLFTITPFYIHAQNNGNYDSPSIPSLIPGLEEQIDVVISPANPAPNQPVTLTLQAFGTDLNRAQISWLINGQVQKNGVGLTSFSFTAGKAGNVSNVTVYILPLNGNKITKEVRIAPASVDLVWESFSYSPPFYKGKGLYPPAGNLTLVALPNLVENGVLIDPKTLIYKWTVGGSILGDKSGYGKNVLNLTGDILNPSWNVEVEVSSVKGGVTGNGSINVSSYRPLLFFYEDNPLYGLLFNRQLITEFDLKNNEMTVRAMPYYFSVLNPMGGNYNWGINGEVITVPANQNAVTFRKPDNTDGASIIAAKAVNPSSFLQSANASLKINFSKSNATFTF